MNFYSHMKTGDEENDDVTFKTAFLGGTLFSFVQFGTVVLSCRYVRKANRSWFLEINLCRHIPIFLFNCKAAIEILLHKIEQ